MASGDTAGAKETNEKFITATKENVVCLVNGTPIVGHVKAMVHYSMGDKEACAEALVSANHNAAVLFAASVVVSTGPLAALAGISGGILADVISAKCNKLITDKDVSNPTQSVIDAFTKKDATFGEKFDAAASLAFDSLHGFSRGKAIENNS